MAGKHLHSVVFAGLATSVLAQHGGSSSCGEAVVLSTEEWVLRIFGSIVLLALSALFSGLTLGLLGLDTNQLEIIKEAGTPSERKYAEIIAPVRAQGNRLLTTLVLGNVAVISLQSILMADLTTGLIGFLLSTALTVVFGEIIPQALCARYALYIGARAVPIVRVIMFLMYPVSAPLAFILDKMMGEEIGTYYTKMEFLKLVKMHVESNRLDSGEAGIIGGAITYKDKRVKTIMTPASSMFSLTERDVLDYDTMELVFRTGFSRVPVWNGARTAIVGVLLAKDLLLVSPAQAHPVAAVLAFFNRTSVISVDDEESLETTLKIFMTTRQHFATVRSVDSSGPGDPVYHIAGLVTLEDVLEEIIGAEIVDEYDAARSSAAVAVGTGSMSKHAVREAILRAAFDDAQSSEDAAGLGVAKNGMTEPEIRAVAAHLAANCAPFSRTSVADVAALVRASQVTDAVALLPALESEAAGKDSSGTRTGAGGASLSALRPLHTLYTRGEADECASVCTVVLQGTLEVRAGADSILAHAGPWDILAARALVDARYTPDFTAVPRTPIARVLRIDRGTFIAMREGRLPSQEGLAHERSGTEGNVGHTSVRLELDGEGSGGAGWAAPAGHGTGDRAYGSLNSVSGSLSPSGGGGEHPPLHRVPSLLPSRGPGSPRMSPRLNALRAEGNDASPLLRAGEGPPVHVTSAAAPLAGRGATATGAKHTLPPSDPWSAQGQATHSTTVEVREASEW